MARFISIFFIILILLLVLLFTKLNAEPVSLNYYLGQIEQPLALILVVTFVAGSLIGLLSSVLVILSSRHEVSKLRKQIKQIKHTEQEVMNLRSIPIKDKH